MQTIWENLKNRQMRVRPGVVVDEETNTATFLIWNLTGQLVGYQRYNPNANKTRSNAEDGRYYNWIGDEGKGKKMALWGVESLSLRPDVLFITEGVFDANRVHLAGYPCVATMTNNPVWMRSWLRALSRTVIVIADNDDAGTKLKKFGDCAYSTPHPYKDLDEMPQEEVNAFLWEILNFRYL